MFGCYSILLKYDVMYNEVVGYRVPSTMPSNNTFIVLFNLYMAHQYQTEGQALKFNITLHV